MSTILLTSSKKRDNKLYEDNNIKPIKNIKAKTELLNEDMAQTEEEIIDELINRKLTNNICTLKFDNKTKNTSIKSKPYKLKSRRICHSVDSKKPKKMKLKDWLNDNIENTSKIEEEIEDLIIEIFVNRFNSYPEKDCPMSENALESKKQIDIYCSKFYEFSIYLLYVIYQKFYTFFEYLTKKINFKTLKMSELNKIKEILFLTGVDIKKVFKKAFEKTNNFNLSSILIIMFDEYLVKENKITICKEIKNSPFYKEKEKFEKYLKIVKQNIYFFDTYFQLDIEEESNQIYSKFFENNNYIVNEEESEKVNENSNEINEEKGENESTEVEVEENNEINEENDKESKQINNDNKINGVKKEKKNKNLGRVNENDCSIQNLNIDDLVNYINDSDNKDNKKKRKKKKKGKKQEKIKIEQIKKIENDYVEEDLVYIKYKHSLEKYTKNVLRTKKVKPKYSEEFLKKISILAQ